MEKKYHMGTNYLLHVINGKWKASIICALGIKKMRYLELLRYERSENHAYISRKVLTEQLNQLITDGLITKTNFMTMPPKVVYSTTSFGQKLAKEITHLNFLGEELTSATSQTVNFDISAKEVVKRHRNKQLI